MDIRVLLADDEALVRTGLSLILSTEPGLKVVAQVCNGREAVQNVDALDIDVAVIDIRMPVMDGVEATRLITASSTSTRVLILTTFVQTKRFLQLSGRGQAASC